MANFLLQVIDTQLGTDDQSLMAQIVEVARHARTNRASERGGGRDGAGLVGRKAACACADKGLRSRPRACPWPLRALRPLLLVWHHQKGRAHAGAERAGRRGGGRRSAEEGVVKVGRGRGRPPAAAAARSNPPPPSLPTAPYSLPRRFTPRPAASLSAGPGPHFHRPVDRGACRQRRLLLPGPPSLSRAIPPQPRGFKAAAGVASPGKGPSPCLQAPGAPALSARNPVGFDSAGEASRRAQNAANRWVRLPAGPCHSPAGSG